ncbi:MAG: DUF6691 family protein [Oleiphilus sp.]
MIRTLSALSAGLLFGFGLIQSEMVNPKRVQGFLDITGQWDPTLVFVMGGALLVSSLGFKLLFFREQPLFEKRFFIPTNKVIDSRLLVGAILFGIGWGLSGLCPGPAIVGLATLNGDILVFVGAMVIGMKAFDCFEKTSKA